MIIQLLLFLMRLQQVIYFGFIKIRGGEKKTFFSFFNKCNLFKSFFLCIPSKFLHFELHKIHYLFLNVIGEIVITL